jgi:hypothetical protein
MFAPSAVGTHYSSHPCRGGNNYSGAGVLVNLPSGGAALLLAESPSVPDFVGMMKGVENGELNAQAR